MDSTKRAPADRGRGAAVCSDASNLITTAQQDSPDPTSAALLARLSAVFSVLAEYRPLAIGVHLAIHAVLPGTSLRLIHRALSMHCGRRCYLAALAAGGSRYALDGTPTDSVSDQHRQAARARLAAPPRKAGKPGTPGVKAARLLALKAKLEAPNPPPVLPTLSLTKRRRRS
jgi:sRNA-binding protein